MHRTWTRIVVFTASLLIAVVGITACQSASVPASPLPTPGLPICPDLPRPAMLFQLDSEDTRYVLYHLTGSTECALQFDPPVSRILALTSTGVYYTSVITSEDAIAEQVIRYANDGTVTLLPYIGVTAPFHFLVSSDGSRVAWGRTESKATTEGDGILVSELYSANSDGSEIRLLYSHDNTIEAGESRIAQPLSFTDDGNLLFTIQQIGKGGRWDAYTGRYSNLYSVPIGGGDAVLIYECSPENRGDCIGDVSANNAYFAVTNRNLGEVVIYNLRGTLITTYVGPGQGYTGRPNFNSDGDLVFMSADVTADGSIKQGYISYAQKSYKDAALPIFTGLVRYIWSWVDEEHILCSGDFDFVIDLQGNVIRLPDAYARFWGVLP